VCDLPKNKVQVTKALAYFGVARPSVTTANKFEKHRRQVKSWIDVGGVANGDDGDAGDDIEMEVPVQLLQLPSHEGERTNRCQCHKTFISLSVRT
jgi:hypothetical protein